MYKLLRHFLFSFYPETAHQIPMRLLIILRYIPFARNFIRLLYNYNHKGLEREVFGIKFKNPVGLAAGLDKNGEYYNDLANFGFGFIELGSLTPEKQGGNAKPRCFRLVQDEAIINRMGINNKGARYTLEQLKKNKPNIIVGGNISKATSTRNQEAGKDYEKAFSLLYDFVDYFVINVSCPNVQDLTKLQDIESLSEIIDRLLTLRRYFDDYRPILLKVSPDITKTHLDEIIDLVLISGIDGIVACNTTRDRSNLSTSNDKVKAIGEGGLSGAPLFDKSISVIKYIHKRTDGLLPIIAVGGIMTPKQAGQMLDAGASLIQIYTGFIYEGPGLIKRILKYINKRNNG